MTDNVIDLTQIIEAAEAEQAADDLKKKQGPVGPVKSKPPFRVVSGDSYVEVVDGVAYHSHAGETITFRRGIPLDSFLTAMDIQNLQGLSDATPEERAEIKDMFQRVCFDLTGVIRKWTWTDDMGDPIASPPSFEDIAGLPIEEVMWLVGVSMGGEPTAAGAEGEG